MSTHNMMMMICVLHPFQHYLVHIKTMKVLCNEVPFSHEVKSNSSRIQTRDIMSQSQEC